MLKYCCFIKYFSGDFSFHLNENQEQNVTVQFSLKCRSVMIKKGLQNKSQKQKTTNKIFFNVVNHWLHHLVYFLYRETTESCYLNKLLHFLAKPACVNFRDQCQMRRKHVLMHYFKIFSQLKILVFLFIMLKKMRRTILWSGLSGETCFLI